MEHLDEPLQPLGHAVDEGPAAEQARRRRSSRRRITAAMVLALLAAAPAGFARVMWLDVPTECRRLNSGAAVDACIVGERGELFWMGQATGIAVVGLAIAALVVGSTGGGARAAGVLVGAVVTTSIVNVWLSRGLSYDQITGNGFPIAYLPTTALVAWLALRWVPDAVVDDDRGVLASWASLLLSASASLVVGSLLGTRERMLWWFGPVVLCALALAAIVSSGAPPSDRRARSRRLTAILVPVGCAAALVASAIG